MKVQSKPLEEQNLPNKLVSPFLQTCKLAVIYMVGFLELRKQFFEYDKHRKDVVYDFAHGGRFHAA